MTLSPNYVGKKHMRPILKREIEDAYRHSRSSAEAARYLNTTYIRFKKYALLYGLFKTNKYSIGIPKYRVRGKSFSTLENILAGNRPNYDLRRLKERLIRANLIETKCNLCGFDECRPDGRQPTILYFKDGDRKNFALDNLELRCYNCIYLTSGTLKDANYISQFNIHDLLKHQEQKFQLPTIEGDAEFAGINDLDMENIRNEVAEELENDSK
jgi:hypothetical protein